MTMDSLLSGKSPSASSVTQRKWWSTHRCPTSSLQTSSTCLISASDPNRFLSESVTINTSTWKFRRISSIQLGIRCRENLPLSLSYLVLDGRLTGLSTSSMQATLTATLSCAHRTRAIKTPLSDTFSFFRPSRSTMSSKTWNRWTHLTWSITLSL